MAQDAEAASRAVNDALEAHTGTAKRSTHAPPRRTASWAR
jgi:hypothetical protein